MEQNLYPQTSQQASIYRFVAAMSTEHYQFDFCLFGLIGASRHWLVLGLAVFDPFYYRNAERLGMHIKNIFPCNSSYLYLMPTGYKLQHILARYYVVAICNTFQVKPCITSTTSGTSVFTHACMCKYVWFFEEQLNEDTQPTQCSIYCKNEASYLTVCCAWERSPWFPGNPITVDEARY